MPQIFRRSANTLSKVSIFGLLLLVGGLILLAMVIGRSSYATRQQIFVEQPLQFSHSIHIKKGVGCETCHGRIDQMPLTYQENSLLMEWCINCHKNPAPNLRPRSEITTMGYRPAMDQAILGPQLMKEYNVNPPTSCSTCHR